jgi:phosphoribosylamine--glycine ligase
MRILLLGSGGREHAIALKLTQSPLCEKLLLHLVMQVLLSAANLTFGFNDFDAIKKACIDEKIDMVMVGPEEPLVSILIFNEQSGIKNIAVIGPERIVQLEGSKAFAKAFMERHNIPTAAYKEFTLANYQEEIKYIQNHSLPIVMKADGLAAGKGSYLHHLEAVANLN